LRLFFSIFEVRGGIFFLNVVWLKYDHFFYCKTDNFSCLNKINCLVNCSCQYSYNLMLTSNCMSTL
jgi:hypothetical protein